jgi:hypothetical protein
MGANLTQVKQILGSCKAAAVCREIYPIVRALHTGLRRRAKIFTATAKSIDGDIWNRDTAGGAHRSPVSVNQTEAHEYLKPACEHLQARLAPIAGKMKPEYIADAYEFINCGALPYYGLLSTIWVTAAARTINDDCSDLHEIVRLALAQYGKPKTKDQQAAVIIQIEGGRHRGDYMSQGA